MTARKDTGHYTHEQATVLSDLITKRIKSINAPHGQRNSSQKELTLYESNGDDLELSKSEETLWKKSSRREEKM